MNLAVEMCVIAKPFSGAVIPPLQVKPVGRSMLGLRKSDLQSLSALQGVPADRGRKAAGFTYRSQGEGFGFRSDPLSSVIVLSVPGLVPVVKGHFREDGMPAGIPPVHIADDQAAVLFKIILVEFAAPQPVVLVIPPDAGRLHPLLPGRDDLYFDSLVDQAFRLSEFKLYGRIRCIDRDLDFAGIHVISPGACFQINLDETAFRNLLQLLRRNADFDILIRFSLIKRVVDVLIRVVPRIDPQPLGLCGLLHRKCQSLALLDESGNIRRRLDDQFSFRSSDRDHGRLRIDSASVLIKSPRDHGIVPGISIGEVAQEIVSDFPVIVVHPPGYVI